MKSIGVVVLAILQVIVVGSAWAGDAPRDVTKDYWLGVYLGNQRFGYVHISVARDKFEGKDAYRLTETSRIKITNSGRMLQEDVTHTLYLDDNFDRVYECVESRSNDPASVPQKMEARYGPDSAKITSTAGMKMQQKDVPVSEQSRAMALVGSKFAIGALPMQVGTKVQAEFLRLVISLERGIEYTSASGTLEAVRNEKIALDGKSYETTLIQDVWKGGTANRWLQADGEIAGMTLPGSQVMFRTESRESATSIDSTGGIDTDTVAVANPPATDARLAVLVTKLSGISDPRTVVSDSRQTGTYDEAAKAALFRTKLQTFEASKSLSMPIPKAGYEAYLAKLGPADPQVKKLAIQIVGTEKNAYKAAEKLADWVCANVTYKLNSTTQLYPEAILKAKEGNCAHMALLYAALARSVGIPTRFAAGFGYGQKTKVLRKHAWAESYVGEWVGLDPMAKDHTVTAAYIKCLESADPKVLSTSMRTVGMSAEVISYTPEAK